MRGATSAAGAAADHARNVINIQTTISGARCSVARLTVDWSSTHTRALVNANPNISREEDYADSAKAAGVDYANLLEQIIRTGTNYQAAWRVDET